MPSGADHQIRGIMSQVKDYAKYVRRPTGRYDVIYALSGKVIRDNLSLLDAAEMVKKTNSPKSNDDGA